MKSIEPDSVFQLYDDPDCLNGLGRDEFLEKLRVTLESYGDSILKEAYLFGSVARGDQTRLSDVDLILVAETKRDFHKRFEDFQEIYNLCPRLDLLIYTPDEFAKLTTQASAGFWADFQKEKLKLI